MATEESRFQKKILDWLEKERNIVCPKQNASGLSKTGIPDIIANINGLFVAIEVKTETGTASPLQLYYIDKINSQNGIAVAIRPSQFNALKRIIDRYLDSGDRSQFKKSMLLEIGTM